MPIRFRDRKPVAALLESPAEVASYVRLTSRLGGYYYRPFARRALAMTDRIEGDMLEIGPGPGRFLGVFARLAPDWRLTGLDVCEPMLEEAREYLGEEGLLQRVTLVRGDALAAPFADASFDLICAMNFMHHIQDPHMFFSEVTRLLRPGGVAVIQAWNRGVNPALAVAARLQSGVCTLLRFPLTGAAVILPSSLNEKEIWESVGGIRGVVVEVAGGAGVSLRVVLRRLDD